MFAVNLFAIMGIASMVSVCAIKPTPDHTVIKGGIVQLWLKKVKRPVYVTLMCMYK